MAVNILAADMWVIRDFSDPNERFRRFLSTAKPRFQNFFDSTLLYDEVVIPTQDFMSLAVIIQSLGPEPTALLLDENVIKIARAKGSLCYLGNGSGLRSFTLGEEDNQGAVSGPKEEAIAWALKGAGIVDSRQSKVLLDKIYNNTIELDLKNSYEEIRGETYNDILRSEYFIQELKFPEDLSSLPGIEPKGLTVYNGSRIDKFGSNQIDSLLAVAHSNLEMKLANLAECSDVSTNTPIGHLLRGKQERINAAKMHAGQVRLFELTEVPDVGSWALENPNKIEKLLKLRSSRSGTSFRNWFHAEAIKENPDIAKSYIELLSETNAFNSTPMRVVRFLCTAAWAAIEPISGTAATIADNFLMGKSEAMASPKFFIENLKQLPKR